MSTAPQPAPKSKDPLFSRNELLAIVVVVALCCIGMLYSHFGSVFARGDEIQFDDKAQSRNLPQSEGKPFSGSVPGDGGSGDLVVFHVSGAVKSPGVYYMHEGGRIFTAIQSAGGAREDAYLDGLNLAERVTDGEKIVVPSKADTARGAAANPQIPDSGEGGGMSFIQSEASKGVPIIIKPSGSSESSSNKLKNPGEGVVNVNTASITELQRLPGVGPSTAQKIIEYRTQNGRLSKPEDMENVKGIGPKKLEKMLPFLAF